MILQDHWFTDYFFFFSSRRRHTRLQGDWSSDVCSSDLSSFPSITRTATGAPLLTPVTSEGVVWAMEDRWAPEPTRGGPARTSYEFPGRYKGLAGRFAVSSLTAPGGRPFSKIPAYVTTSP